MGLSLLNCGMNMPFLQKLGGWKHLGSMQKYLRILPETIRREYQAAYKKMQEQVEEKSRRNYVAYRLYADSRGVSKHYHHMQMIAGNC